MDHHLKDRHQIEPEVDYWTEASDFEENPRLRLKCQLCDEMMRSREAVMTHAKYHNLCREPKRNIGRELTEEMLKCKLEIMDVGCAVETHLDPPGKREWVCPLCKAKKYLFAELNIHMYEHQGAKFVCRACPFSFNYHREVVRHISQKHPHRPPGITVSKPDDIDLMDRLNVKCVICAGEISNLKSLERHIAQHNAVQIAEESTEEEEPPPEEQNDYEFICCICKQSLKKRSNLTIHLTGHFKEFRYKCQKCGSGFVWKRSIVRHVENYHAGDSAKDLIEIIGEHKGDINDFQCSICGEDLSDKKSVFMHTELHSDSQSGRISEPVCICPICNKTIDRWTLLKIHVSKHLETHKYQCLVCEGETYASLNALSHHLKESHVDMDLETGYRRISEPVQGELNYQCAICSHRLTSEEKVLKHAEKHSKTLNLPATQPNVDDTPMKSVPKEQTLICPICPKKMQGRVKLKQHVRRHWFLTYYQCSLCSKEFTYLGDLQNHGKLEHEDGNLVPKERLEEKIVDCSCQICGEKITNKKDTKFHTYLHNFHKKDHFSCSLCFKMFPTLSEWTEHKTSVQCMAARYKVWEWVQVGE